LLGDWRFRAANIHESSSAVLRWRVSIVQACVSANARTASERSYHRYAQRVAGAIDIGSDLSGENENVMSVLDIANTFSLVGAMRDARKVLFTAANEMKCRQFTRSVVQR
jgi:hypothetical protein